MLGRKHETTEEVEKTASEHLETALDELKKASQQAQEELRAKIDSAISRAREALDDVRSKVEDRAEDVKESVEEERDKVGIAPRTSRRASRRGATRSTPRSDRGSASRAGAPTLMALDGAPEGRVRQGARRGYPTALCAKVGR